jgi:hypothetical protein
MLLLLAFHFSLSLNPNCRNRSPNYSVLVVLVGPKNTKIDQTTILGLFFFFCNFWSFSDIFGDFFLNKASDERVGAPLL